MTGSHAGGMSPDPRAQGLSYSADRQFSASPTVAVQLDGKLFEPTAEPVQSDPVSPTVTVTPLPHVVIFCGNSETNWLHSETSCDCVRSTSSSLSLTPPVLPP